MGRVAPEKRTARGLHELRKRYVRRAEHLCRDPEFVTAIKEQARPEWDREYPDYPLSSGPGNAVHHPAALVAALEKEHAESRGAADFSRGLILRTSRASRARDVWLELMHDIAAVFWPERDFPRVFGVNRPLTQFAARCMYREPQTLEWECEEIFSVTLHLVPEPMLERRGEYAFDGMPPDEIDAVTWCLPLYPGVTAKDIEQAAPAIEEHAHRVYGTRTMTARVHALRDEGLTHQQIADRLGLKAGTVSATLRDNAS